MPSLQTTEKRTCQVSKEENITSLTAAEKKLGAKQKKRGWFTKIAELVALLAPQNVFEKVKGLFCKKYKGIQKKTIRDGLARCVKQDAGNKKSEVRKFWLKSAKAWK